LNSDRALIRSDLPVELWPSPPFVVLSVARCSPAADIPSLPHNTRNRRLKMGAGKKSDEPTKAPAQEPARLLGKLKRLGGSMSDDWNNILANQAVQTLWLKNSDADQVRRQRHAAADALIGISPRDEIEGMLAAQLVACHNASMECYRRAMIGEQTFNKFSKSRVARPGGLQGKWAGRVPETRCGTAAFDTRGYRTSRGRRF
jgi:hypothetical protein